MTAFESMSDKLSKTGLYNTSEGKMVYAELMAYAAGLDIYCNALDELLRECFVSSAESYGLTLREKILCKCVNDDSIEGRRKSLLAAMSILNTDFTSQGFQKCLEIFGIEGTLIQDYENKKLDFHCTTEISSDKLEKIKQQLAAFVPCCFDFTFYPINT